MEIVIGLLLIVPVVLGIRATRSGSSSGVGCCAPSDPRRDLRMASAYSIDHVGEEPLG
jgi:hypothetical protein